MSRGRQDTGRAFLVGCPRSGTTLLQSLLFIHPRVFSCPETFFFMRAVNASGTRHRLRLAAQGAQQACAALVDLGLAEKAPPPTRWPRTERWCGRWFGGALDRTACRAQRDVWIEKTPSHLHRAATIQRVVRRARFIHLIREGAPTVASLYEVTHRYPEAWDGERSLEECAAQWSRDVAASVAFAGDPAHAFVAYERLVADPQLVITSVWSFLGLDARTVDLSRMVDEYAERAAEVTVDEPWKQRTTGIVTDRNEDTLLRVLSETERARLRDLIAPAERRRVELPFL